MNRDPIVDEVRQARQKILEDCGGDLEKLLDRLKGPHAERWCHTAGCRRWSPGNRLLSNSATAGCAVPRCATTTRSIASRVNGLRSLQIGSMAPAW